MDDKDPPPFGYTFDFFGTPSSNSFDNGGRSLLSDMESQQLDSFFSHTNPFGFEAAASTFPFATQNASELAGGFATWSTVPPATIHDISTTIPDQTLLHNFHVEQQFVPAQPSNHFSSTADDLQAASTLYAQANVPPSLPAYQPNGRSHSFHGLPSAGLYSNGHEPNGLHNNVPLAPATATPANGMMPEQLAALPSTHNVDTATAQFSNSTASANLDAHLQEHTRPSLKRSYTYGTDTAFHETGFQPSSKHENEEIVTERLMRELHHAQPLTRLVARDPNGTVFETLAELIRTPTADDEDSNEERASDGSSADHDEDKRQRKRQKRPPPVKDGQRKSVSGPAATRSRKASVDDRVKKPRRKSLAGQKTQRENLTEEQKRSNHILSEQKRRNLIKRGFDDLHDLVPEIRKAGLNKSGVLNEAANFLQELIDDNERYSALLGTDG